MSDELTIKYLKDQVLHEVSLRKAAEEKLGAIRENLKRYAYTEDDGIDHEMELQMGVAEGVIAILDREDEAED